MKHIAYVMKGDEKAPAGAWETRSWFYYYKWGQDDEVFVPRKAKTFLSAEPGDMLWLVMDGVLLGRVELVRVMEEAAQRTQEFWYDARAVVQADPRPGETASVRGLLHLVEDGHIPEEILPYFYEALGEELEEVGAGG